MKKSRKYTLIVFAGFILLITIFLFFTQSSFFKEYIKNRLIILAEKQLNLQLEIEKLDGNFYSHLTVENLKLSDNDSTVALFSSLHLNYDLWKLSERVISVDSVIIKNPQINIWQKNDSSWNLSSYLVKNSSSKQKKPFNFEINAKHVALQNGSISLASFSKLIPQQTNNINLLVNGLFNKKQTKVHVKKFEFNTENPAFVLNELSGTYTTNKDGMQLDSLIIRTGGSTIDMKGNYSSKENMNSIIDANRIDNNELAIFIPTFKLLCSPSIKADFSVVNDSIYAQAELLHNNQSLKAQVAVSTLSNLLSKEGTVPYIADLNFANFVIDNWIETNEQRAIIDGNIKLKGTNLLNSNAFVTISADLENSQYNDILFDTLTFNGNYAQDKLNAALNLSSEFGDLQISGVLKNISATPNYKAQIVSDNFNLTAFLPELKSTKINGIIQAEGEGFTANDLLVQAELHLNESSVYMVPVDTLHATIQIDKFNLNIDSLQVYTQGAKATGSGTFSLDSLILESLISANITSAQIIDSFYVLPITFDSLTTISNISGPVNALEIEGAVEIYNANGYSAKLSRADAKYLVSLKTDSLNVHVNTTASIIETAGVKWDTAKVDFNYTEEFIDINANVTWNDTVDARFTTRFTLGDTMAIYIPNFEVKTILSDYYLPDTLSLRIYNQEKIEIKNFVIKDLKEEDFILAANGIISMNDSTNFIVEVSKFNLQQLNTIIGKQDSVKGILEANMAISGMAQDPSMTGSVKIESPGYGKSELNSISSNFNYANQNGFAELIIPEMDSAFYANISVPFKAYFDSLNFIFNPPETFSGTLVIDSLQLSHFPDQLIPNDSLSGIIQGKIDVSGDFYNPLFYGGIDLTEGHYINKKIGLEYDQIKTSVVFDGKKIELDTVLVQQKGGLISLTGNVEFDSTIIRGNVTSSSLQVDANQFFVTKHRNYEVLIDASTFVKTEKENPEFGGKIKVVRSDIYLPAIIPDAKTDFENDVPLLIEAIAASSDSSIFKKIETVDTATKSKQKKIYENLTGRINVEIPRNTWIKNDDMRVELSGDVDIVKTGSFFEIFGDIEVIRGHYILYGRKLNVKESQIIFQGGEELDPVLNVATEYVYRDSNKEKRYLELSISGKVSEPDITFLLDGSEITETDGISVLVFGATSDEIGYENQNGILSSVSANAVAGILSAQLSRTVGTQLKLDMIEITATESWQTAAFVVGKYITNDIFIMYERGFGEVDGDEITPETITLEYEINDKLFLRLQSGSSTTSGVDIILKFEQEIEKTTPKPTPGK